MSAASASSERVRRAVASNCSSTVVLILTRAMPQLYHICGTNVASSARWASCQIRSTGAPRTSWFAQCLPPSIRSAPNKSAFTSVSAYRLLSRRADVTDAARVRAEEAEEQSRHALLVGDVGRVRLVEG